MITPETKAEESDLNQGGQGSHFMHFTAEVGLDFICDEDPSPNQNVVSSFADTAHQYDDRLSTFDNNNRRSLQTTN